MIRVIRICLFFFLIVFICSAGYRTAAAEGTIVLQKQFPVQNEKTRILVHTTEGNPITDASVTVTYRPGSRVEVVSEIGFTDKSGAVDWIPEAPGIVSISANWTENDGTVGTAAANASVKFVSFPIMGILIMILAGLLLIGGSILNFSRFIWGEGSQ